MIYKQKYPDGITTNFWKDFVSPMVIKLKGDKCEMCGSTKQLELHHTDYEKEVNINTLKVLCRSCHIILDNRNKNKRLLNRYQLAKLKKT